MVIVANQVQYAMDNHTIQLVGKLCPIVQSVFPYGINADKQISRQAVSFTIVKGNNVCIVIVLQIFYIDIQNIIIGTKYNGNVSQTLGLTLGHKLEPTGSQALFLKGELAIFGEIRNHN